MMKKMITYDQKEKGIHILVLCKNVAVLQKENPGKILDVSHEKLTS